MMTWLDAEIQRHLAEMDWEKVDQDIAQFHLYMAVERGPCHDAQMLGEGRRGPVAMRADQVMPWARARGWVE